MPGTPGAAMSGTVDFAGHSSRNYCSAATSDLQGDVGAFLAGFGPDPWTVWNASGAKSPTHFDSVDAVAIDSGFMGQGFDGSQRIEMVWGADGSLLAKEQPGATDAMTWIRNFPAATHGSVAVVLTCKAGMSAGMSLAVWRFDGAGALVSKVSFGGDGCAESYIAEIVDDQDRTLVLMDTGPANALKLGARRMMARWLDRAGNALTDWFDTGIPETAFPAARPLIGGGAVIGDNGFQWEATVVSGQAKTGPAPSWLPAGDDFAAVRGAKAYALIANRGDSLTLVAPTGKTCGSVQFAGATHLQVGHDGTVIDMGGSDGCSLRWWEAFLR